MNCELYDDILDEYVDGARASHRADAFDARMAAFESHLAGCSRCQTLVADFTNIRGAAAALDDHLPPAGLWARIASSIDDERRKPWWERRIAGAFSAWVPVAAAAALALLIGGVGWLTWRPAPETPPSVETLRQADQGDITVGEEYYERAIAGLQQIADAQNAGLDPETRAALRRNLAVIDRAISESRAALAAEPASTLAQESLLDALDTKVALLQDTVALSTDIGGELPENAARTAQEVNQ